MKLRMVVVTAAAVLASAAPARAYLGNAEGRTCMGIAPAQVTCSAAFISTSQGVQVEHFRTFGTLKIEVTSPTGSWTIECGQVPTLFGSDCTDSFKGGFLKAQVINVKVTLGGVPAGHWRVEVRTP